MSTVSALEAIQDDAIAATIRVLLRDGLLDYSAVDKAYGTPETPRRLASELFQHDVLRELGRTR
jgi:hypothetical protein